MDYFMNRENVNQYKKMLVDYDGVWLINKLSEYVSDGVTILELGMGAGLDLELLAKKYNVLGSDNSPIFIDDYKAKDTGINVILLDAISIDINDKFDCIFSNKVLQHLTKQQFIQSLDNQKSHLNAQGIIFFSLWYGEHIEELMFDGQLRFTYYTEKDIEDIVKDDFNILNLERYTESDDMDSLLVVLTTR